MHHLLTESLRFESEIIALRRDLHRHPEPGKKEFLTSARIEKELTALGIDVKRIAGTAVVGTLKGALPGKCVALRADMDALPVQEKADVPHASETPGMMHACGHDMHVAALIGAARLLTAHKAELHGTVKFFFQPDEEDDGGAQPMIDEGCMEGVDAVFGAHVAPELPAGQISLRSGKTYAASNPFDIVIRGRSAHGAEPHLSVDALVTASAVVLNLQTLISRNISPLEPAVLTIGSLHAGTVRNVIADEARLSGTIRCFGTETRNLLVRRMTEIAESTAAALGATAEINAQWGYSGVINDPAMTDLARASAAKLVGAENVVEMPEPSLATEDFGAFLEHAPGSYWHIGVGRPDQENAPLHSPYFDPDESALAVAAAVHAQIALDFLNT